MTTLGTAPDGKEKWLIDPLGDRIPSRSIRTERQGALRQIDRDQALKILHELSDYASSGKGQIKKLRGSGDLRLRVGDYRVRFEMIELEAEPLPRSSGVTSC